MAHLSGFRIGQDKGDAVILDGIEPAVQLDQYLNELLLNAERAANHRELARQIIEIVRQLGQAKLGHSDLHLGNFLLQDGKLFLLDGYAIHGGGMTLRDIMMLGHSVTRFATKTDLLRGWRAFGDGPPPKRNRLRRRQWRKLLGAARGENAYFGRLRAGEWSGFFFKHHKFPRRWAPASRIDVDGADWEREWPRLLGRTEADQLDTLKRSPSGDVMSGEIVLGGRPISVVVKRNRRRRWFRYLTEIGRGGRAARAWKKAWQLIARDIPTAWPMLMMEKRALGYTTDSVIVFERVAGTQLSDFDFESLPPAQRQDLFRRLGRTLRRLEQSGLRQYDSKSTNWIITDDPKLGPVPVIVDVDGIRTITPALWPIDRLLRSMREHSQYTPTDSRELCLGYAPFARLMREEHAEAAS